MDKMLTTAALLLFTCFTGIPQATYQELTPGQSTRADVERLLGQPVNKVSQTLHEYGPKWSARKIYVQYAQSSAVVDRIEVLLADAVSPADARMYFRIAAPPGEPFGGNSPYRSESLRRELLSLRPAATRTRKERLEEYFDKPYYMVLTHESEEASSRVNQIGYYSSQLFEAAVADVRRTAGDGTARGGTRGDDSSTSGGFLLEYDHQLHGTTLTYYGRSRIEECQADCANNPKCQGFTWIRAGTYNRNDEAMCYLVASVTNSSPARGHISGRKK